MTIPFNKPYITGKELGNISEAHTIGRLSGDGCFTKKCSVWLQKNSGAHKALLTHSCTAALEMAAILADIQPGDEVIMPSYTFVSTANAFVLRGGVPVFVDIRPDTFNIDETKIEDAITKKTKAIVPVHYAGVGCDMDVIMKTANQYKLLVIEDAAQGILGSYKGRPLGSIGHMGCYSFHETKNIISGEGGALLINDPALIDRAEIIREKGTDRSRFFRGEVDKYTWMDIGSSFLPGEIIAAFLWAQLQEAEGISSQRRKLWDCYHQSFSQLKGLYCRSPLIPSECDHNAHIYHLLFKGIEERSKFIDHMKGYKINTLFHYIPLHSSDYGLKKGRYLGDMATTDYVANSIVRLPLWLGMESKQKYIIDAAEKFFDRNTNS
jgi:dTDP-4-amino-4,6-dideoxygalactose transaminase